jgi:PPR repeat family
LFDAVISKPDDNINNDKKSYSNKEKSEIIEISKAFSNKNLRPNIRTYNTVLKALRGYTGFEKCMDVIRIMKANDIDPDTVTMNTLIDAAVVSGNLEIANDVSQLNTAEYVNKVMHFIGHVSSNRLIILSMKCLMLSSSRQSGGNHQHSPRNIISNTFTSYTAYLNCSLINML